MSDVGEEIMTAKIDDYWKEHRLPRDTCDLVVKSEVCESVGFMQDVAGRNVHLIEEDIGEHYENSYDWNYWAAFADICGCLTDALQTETGTNSKDRIAIRQARMAGMLDAFNIIREKLVKGEFDRTGGRY